MSEEHPIDRFQKAMKEEEKAAAILEAMQQRFASMAEQMRHWQRLGFNGRLEDGTILQSTREPIATLNINEKLPTIPEIYSASRAYQDARTRAQGAYQALTSDQKQMLQPQLRR